MKIGDEIITNHLKELLDEKHISMDYFVKQAVVHGISRATVYKIAADRHYKMGEVISHELTKLLNVTHDKLITWSPNFKTYSDNNPYGFTPKKLKVLSEEMSSIGIDLYYQVYSHNNAMNVTTRYALNRRMYLDGN